MCGIPLIIVLLIFETDVSFSLLSRQIGKWYPKMCQVWGVFVCILVRYIDATTWVAIHLLARAWYISENIIQNKKDGRSNEMREICRVADAHTTIVAIPGHDRDLDLEVARGGKPRLLYSS